MLPLHHDPGWDISCRGLRLIQSIASVLVTVSVRVRPAEFEPAVSSPVNLRIGQALPGPGHCCEQLVWESNPPLRLERAVSLADRRTSHFSRSGPGRLESPSAGLQPAARPSQLPTRSAIPTKRPGVFVTPGLRLRTRDVRGRALRLQGIEPERVRRRIGESLRFLATQDVARTPGKHGRPRCNWCLRPTRLGTNLTARPSSCTLTDASPREDVRAISKRLSRLLAVVGEVNQARAVGRGPRPAGRRGLSPPTRPRHPPRRPPAHRTGTRRMGWRLPTGNAVASTLTHLIDTGYDGFGRRHTDLRRISAPTTQQCSTVLVVFPVMYNRS